MSKSTGCLHACVDVTHTQKTMASEKQRAKDELANGRFFVWLFDSKALGIGNCNGEFLFENFSVLVRRQTKLVEAGVRHWQHACTVSHFHANYLEFHLTHATDRNTVTARRKQEQLFLQLQ